MVYELQVVTLHDDKHLAQLINDGLEWIIQRGYKVELDFRQLDTDIDSLNFRLSGTGAENSFFGPEDIVCICKHQLSEVLAEHIVTAWESRLLWREIQRSYRSGSLSDKHCLLAKAQNFIQGCYSTEGLNMLMNFGRKSRIANRILGHIEDERQLVVEGFITFCMQDYMTEIRFAVEVAIEELRNEKEYNDFVNLLRYFVESQAPKVQEVHLMMGTNGAFYLWDGAGSKIEQDYMDYYLEEMLLEEISIDDVLISILVTIAPQRIVIHQEEALSPKESVNMIRHVFRDRITACPGCELCRQKRSEFRIKPP